MGQIRKGERLVHPASAGGRRIAKVMIGDEQRWPPPAPPLPPAPWTPAAIETAMWFDIADLSTLTLNPTNTPFPTIIEWRDKSGKGIVISQAAANLQFFYPVTANGNPVQIGGMDVTRGRGVANAVMITPTEGALSLPLRAHSVFMVINRTQNINGNNVFSVDPSSGASGWLNPESVSMSLRQQPELFEYGNFGYWPFYRGTQSPVQIQDWLFGHLVDVDAGRAGHYLNGSVAPITSPQTPPAEWAEFARGRFMIAGTGNGSGGFNRNSFTDYAEIIWLAGFVSDDLRQRVEGYLAHKWLLTERLPADHPYKTTWPTMPAAAAAFGTPEEASRAQELAALRQRDGGRFVANDPSTPQNEAWLSGVAP